MNLTAFLSVPDANREEGPGGEPEVEASQLVWKKCRFRRLGCLGL